MHYVVYIGTFYKNFNVSGYIVTKIYRGVGDKQLKCIFCKNIVFDNQTIFLQSLNETVTSLVLSERSELTRLGLSLETVFGSVFFLSLSKFLSFFIAIKKKEIWCGVRGCIAPDKINI